MYDNLSMCAVSGITVSRTDDRLIAVKRASGDDAPRCRNEAHLIARLDHPGLVQYVTLIDGDPVELHTAYAGTDTWDRTPPKTTRRIIEGLATVASTVADLHDLGTAHRSLVPGHVIVGSDHRPVLCGLGDALPLDPLTEADDMAGLAGLIRTVARAANDELRSQLEPLAEQAIAGDLSARSLTNGIDALHRREPSRPANRRRRGVALGTGSLIAAVAFALAVGTLTSADDQPVAAPTTLPAAIDRPAATSISVPEPPPTLPALGDAIELVHEGRRYGLGQPGDVAVVGDWNCDGVRTPALLQFESSSVSVFSAWPEPGAPIAPDSSAAIPGATGLEAVEGDQCDRLRVLHSNGSTLYAPEIP